MQEMELVPEAQRQMNACGAGAAAGTLGFAREMGANKALILEHTDSHQVSGNQNFDGTYVGYGSAIIG